MTKFVGNPRFPDNPGAGQISQSEFVALDGVTGPIQPQIDAISSKLIADHVGSTTPPNPQLGEIWFRPDNLSFWARSQFDSQLGANRQGWLSTIERGKGDLFESISSSQSKPMESIRSIASQNPSNANILISRFGVNHLLPTTGSGNWTIELELRNLTTTTFISNSQIFVAGTNTDWRTTYVNASYEIDIASFLNATLYFRLTKTGTPANLTFIPWITYRAIIL